MKILWSALLHRATIITTLGRRRRLQSQRVESSVGADGTGGTIASHHITHRHTEARVKGQRNHFVGVTRRPSPHVYARYPPATNHATPSCARPTFAIDLSPTARTPYQAYMPVNLLTEAPGFYRRPGFHHHSILPTTLQYSFS